MLIDTDDVRMYDLEIVCKRMERKGHPLSLSDLLMAVSELMDWMESSERKKWREEQILAKYEYHMKYGRV